MNEGNECVGKAKGETIFQSRLKRVLCEKACFMPLFWLVFAFLRLTKRVQTGANKYLPLEVNAEYYAVSEGRKNGFSMEPTEWNWSADEMENFCALPLYRRLFQCGSWLFCLLRYRLATGSRCGDGETSRDATNIWSYNNVFLANFSHGD